MKFRTGSGMTVSYDDAGAGSTLVFLHGFPLSREMWRPQIDALSRGFRVFAPDLRGFGGTTGFTETPSIEGMAEGVAQFLEALEITSPVALCGLSMGGYVALAFVRKYPQRVRALILADTRAEADDEAGKANRNKMMAFAKEHSAAAVIDQMMPKMFTDTTLSARPEIVAELRRIAAEQSVPAIVHAVQAMRDRPDSTPFLEAIAAPTLVIVGGEDAITPPAMSENLARRISGAKLVTIPGAGHMSNLERTSEFNEAIRSFLLSQS